MLTPEQRLEIRHRAQAAFAIERYEPAPKRTPYLDPLTASAERQRLARIAELAGKEIDQSAIDGWLEDYRREELVPTIVAEFLAGRFVRDIAKTHQIPLFPVRQIIHRNTTREQRSGVLSRQRAVANRRLKTGRKASA